MTLHLYTRSVRRCATVAAIGVAAAAITHAANALAAPGGAPPGPAANPPVLSTTPTPPLGVVPEPTQMSGLPLQVGDLPPGTLSVRVIRRSFADNVVNQPVELHVAGRTLKATTDSAGRAMFQGLAVGDMVDARSVVDGEVLESQRFELPSQGGVRVVLVAGVAAGVSAGARETASLWPPVANQPQPSEAADSRTGGFTWLIPPALVVLGAAVWISRIGRRAAGTQSVESARAGRSGDAASDPREVLFKALIRVEQERGAGNIAEDAYATRRDGLIAELVQLDTTKGLSASHPGRRGTDVVV